MYRWLQSHPSWLGAKARRLQGTLFNTFTPIIVHILSAIAVKQQTWVVLTDGSGCWMLPPFAVLPKPSLIEPCPRLHAPQSSEQRHEWRAHLPFPVHLPSLALRNCHRERELTVPAEILLSSRSTPESGCQPTTLLPGQACIPTTWRFSWADTSMWPSVNPELLDSRNGIILTAQSSHTVLDTELAEEMFIG